MVVIGDLTVKWGNNNWVSTHYTVRVDKLEEGSNMPCSSRNDNKYDQCLYHEGMMDNHSMKPLFSFTLML